MTAKIGRLATRFEITCTLWRRFSVFISTQGSKEESAAQRLKRGSTLAAAAPSRARREVIMIDEYTSAKWGRSPTVPDLPRISSSIWKGQVGDPPHYS